MGSGMPWRLTAQKAYLSGHNGHAAPVAAARTRGLALMSMIVVTVVGARPQFVKAAVVSRALRATATVSEILVHTGQHYDPGMSDVFFSQLGIAPPAYNLEIGSLPHGAQTGRMLERIEGILQETTPDWVVVYGDTNSTLAGALAAAKLHVPVAHVEAGLRSFNRAMPEEVNRVLTDHLSTVLFTPTEAAVNNLGAEGIPRERVTEVGDVMYDAALYYSAQALDMPSPVAPFGVAAGEYVLATVHRAENTDDPRRLAAVVDQLAGLDRPVVLLAHPRVVAKAADHGIPLTCGSLIAHPPVAYADLIASVQQSAGVVTDSGGLQKEAFLLRVPCTTVRTETEWVETVELGWNVLAGTDGDDIADAVTRPRPMPTDAVPYGDGNAAGRVVEVLRTHTP